MIWLASFPRSGNTFLRNVLYEVYGLESATFHKEDAYPLDENYHQYPIVKTHLLPSQLIPDDPAIKSVYLVRDGRDALVSLAHHKKDIVAPGSNFYENLMEAIIAAEGSYFGGWSVNAELWIEKADLIIRFEDLIIHPLLCAERLQAIMDLPEPDPDRLPGFAQLKSGKAKYGAGKAFTDSESAVRELANKNFRKGKPGNWKEEMPDELHDLFWNYHGHLMERLGYSYEGEIKEPDTEFEAPLKIKMGHDVPGPETKKKVLIEATKLVEEKSDGIKRYVFELLKALVWVAKNPFSRFDLDIFIDGNVYALADYAEMLNIEEAALQRKLLIYEKILLGIKKGIKTALPKPFYENMAEKYRQGGFRRKLAKFKSNVVEKNKRNKLKKGERLKIEEDDFAKYDLIHLTLPQNYEPFLGSNPKFVTTVHDLTHKIFPGFHLADNIELAEKGMAFICDYQSNVIAVSNATAKDIEQHYSGYGSLEVVYESADNLKFHKPFNEHLSALVLDKYKIPLQPFFLCLSTIEPRKNLVKTVKAFLKSGLKDVKLVIAGKQGWKMDELNALTGHSKDIILTGFVDEIDLPVLYAKSMALCYISVYEGFGLPALEAMSCGTPVIYGNNSALPEVVDEGGLPADAANIDDIAKQMKRIATEPGLRDELAKRALHRSLQFSWRKTTKQTLDIYKKVLES
jgi:glycosyltransferase involved in cell wall biosynthesis